MTFRHIAFGIFLLTALGFGACRSDTAASAPIELTEAFFAALETEDAARAQALLADGAMLYAPYNPNGDASDAAIRRFPAHLYVAGAMQTYDNLIWQDRRYSVADDGQTVWVEANGKLTVAETGEPYHNRYVFKLTVVDGKITEITEYTNVATLARHGVTARAD